MRLIHTFTNPDQAQAFSNLLTENSIQHTVEPMQNNDWGNENYGVTTYNLWVTDEDQAVAAVRLLEIFKSDPKETKFTGNTVFNIPVTPLTQEKEIPKRPVERPFKSPITNYILLLCTLLFIASNFTSTKSNPLNSSSSYFPSALTSPVNKALMYDYPETYQLIDQLVSLYGPEDLQTPNKLSPEGQFLYQKAMNTPFWQGYYKSVIRYFHPESGPEQPPVPMFEKIRQGEIWRLFTPALLHYDIFHIFFNMIWLLILGKQMERQLGSFRYIFFILIAAIISNTAQYLVSGANFLGFSGVVCAMIVYIWVRLYKAPWEGYQLQKSSILFVSIFVLAIFGIELLSFFLEASGLPAFSIGIANSAHMVGAFVGYLFGRFKNILLPQ